MDKSEDIQTEEIVTQPHEEFSCISCGEEMIRNECPKSTLDCGHHCNCSWIHDYCHFCEANFGEEGKITSYGSPHVI